MAQIFWKTPLEGRLQEDVYDAHRCDMCGKGESIGG